MTDFSGLELIEPLRRAISAEGYTAPTPIQAQSIPHLLKGRDLLGVAQTGTGKTAAFVLPMLQNLTASSQGRPQSGRPRALILAPTRELAVQIGDSVRAYGKFLNIRGTNIFGGAPMGKQIKALQDGVDIVIATPGRLMDLLNQKKLRLDAVEIFVLDEADRMLDIGFAPAIKRIVRETPDDRQTMLFSATFNKDVAKMAEQYLYEPVRIEVERAGSSNKDVEHELIVIEQEDKTRVLKKILNDFDGTVLVFSRTRHGARKLSRIVRDNGHTAAELHADRTLEQRRNALQGFKDGRFRVLVATDIAARGIDVKDIGMVLNFDVPKSAEDYVHRTGRTGRAGSKGHAVTLVTPEQGNEVRGIEKLIQFELPLSSRSSASLAKGVGKKPRSHRSRSRNRRATVA